MFIIVDIMCRNRFVYRSSIYYALFLRFGEQSLLAVKNRDLDEIRKEVGRRSEERGDIPRA